MQIRPDPDSQDYWDQDKFPHLSSYVGGGHLRDMQSSWQYIEWLSFSAWKIMPGTAALNQSTIKTIIQDCQKASRIFCSVSDLDP